MLNNDFVRLGLVVLAAFLLLQLLTRTNSLVPNKGAVSVETRPQNAQPRPPLVHTPPVNEGYYGEQEDEDEDQDNDENNDNLEEDLGVEDIDEVPAETQADNEESAPSSGVEGFNNGLDSAPASAASVPNRPSDCFPKDQLNADDLLPKDKYSKWASVNPTGSGELSDRNFVEAGYHFGVNTQGQSLRNANYQLRSEPANPQVKVSPWMQSTIGPDTNRRPLEIGGC